MNGRALAIAPGLLVTVTSTALIGTATAAAIDAPEQSHPTADGRRGESRRLVGDPADASPADQDSMARHLLATQGLGPWGGSCG